MGRLVENPLEVLDPISFADDLDLDLELGSLGKRDPHEINVDQTSLHRMKLKIGNLDGRRGAFEVEVEDRIASARAHDRSELALETHDLDSKI